jgi:DNA repair protein RadC
MTYQIVSERKVRNPPFIRSPDDIFRYLKRYAGSKQEHFILVTLNCSHRPISVRIISIGSTTRTSICIKELLYYAIKDFQKYLLSLTHIRAAF